MSLTATVIPARTPWKPLMGEYKYKMSLVKKYITKSVRKVEQPLLNVMIARKDKKEREPKQRSNELDKKRLSSEWRSAGRRCCSYRPEEKTFHTRERIDKQNKKEQQQ